MSRSVLISLIISLLILTTFTLVSQEYRFTMQHAVEQPVTAASTATTANDAALHKSTVQEIWHVR